MVYCHNCGSDDVFDYPLERHESWYYCQHCFNTWGDYCPDVPYEMFADQLKEDGFPLTANAILHQQRVPDDE